jgi:hypothetical protein
MVNLTLQELYFQTGRNAKVRPQLIGRQKKGAFYCSTQTQI